MGDIASPELVAAVANSGALGVLPIWSLPLVAAAKSIVATQVLTDKPFAVNLRADLVQREHIALAQELGVHWLHLFWGDPAPSLVDVDRTNAKLRILATVGDERAAEVALAAGADVLFAQGIEAGGHVLSEVTLDRLLEDVLRVAGDTPVIAAGGCVTGTDAARLMRNGAAGVLLGTRFVASSESAAHDEFKSALVAAGDDATTRSVCFDDGWSNAPHRTLSNETVRRWIEAGSPARGGRPGEGDAILVTAKGRAVERYSVAPPSRTMTGDISESALYAGVGAGKVTAVEPVVDIVAELSAHIDALLTVS